MFESFILFLKERSVCIKIEEVLCLKEHTSLNIVEFNSSEYISFVTKQPII